MVRERADREGLSRAERNERGIHGEVSGFACKSNKGVRVGWDAFGVTEEQSKGRAIKRLNNFKEGVCTIFVDNLPNKVFKGDLFHEFGKDNQVKDVFISRKYRRNKKCLFTFIRFGDIECARWVVARMNERYWRGRKLLIMLSKFRRHGQSNERNRWRNMGRYSDKKTNEPDNGERGGRYRKVWREVRRRSNGGGNEENIDASNSAKEKENKMKKEVEGRICESRQELLNRSLMGVSRNPIDFKDVQCQLQEKWKGPGAISSAELLEIFKEVRPHWEFFSSHSRRIWLDVMGLLVQVWCEGTFNNIAKLWGKLIFMDDRTEECMSYSVA
ncbi:hypothetical protein PIB30_070150 [Stylosanthes scabra]|uniref:RRM domain-containing protein n=1 Tax=Stylosanthes scabra TaxID=79078 RepID=A0ABU6ZM19_9FABA|nr:hypothetical protein [Stylosanthes scabra]